MENIGKCESCWYYRGLVEVPNGYLSLTKEKLNCLYFGYLELLTDFESYLKYKAEGKDEK